MPQRVAQDLGSLGHTDERSFATRFSCRLQLYVSPVPDPQAGAVDAFSLSWRGLDVYAFSPLALIGRGLAKVESNHPRLILVAPFWESRPWCPLLNNWPGLQLATSGCR
jgi:hypothetical protein